MSRHERGAVLLAAAATLLAAGCGSAGAGHGQATSTSPSGPSSAGASGRPSPPGLTVAADKRPCTLITSADAATALGMAVGQGRASPGVDLANGAVGGGCQWTDSAGGTAVVVTLTYPSAAIASRLFRSSKGSTAGARSVRLPPRLAPSESADTGSYSGTRIAESFLVNGRHELDVTINAPTSGSGSRFSLRAFVTMVQQAAKAWQ